MSERSFHYTNWTPAATADASGTTSANYMSINGGAATQYTKIKEVMVSGLAGASGAMLMQLGRVSTLGSGTLTLAATATDGFTDPQASVLTSPAVAFTNHVTTAPQRSASDPKLEFNFNAFGGIIRWRADVGNGQWWGILGNTANLGAAIFSQFTGGTSNAISAHLIYETL